MTVNGIFAPRERTPEQMAGAVGKCTSYAGDRIISAVGCIAVVKKSPKIFVKNY